MYNYLEEMKSDILSYLSDESFMEKFDCDTPEDLYNVLYDEFWTIDDITGNESSYADEEECAKMVSENIDLLHDAVNEFCPEITLIQSILNGAQYFDTIMRCYLLGTALEKALDEWFDKK